LTSPGAPAFVVSPYGVAIFDGIINPGGSITYLYPGFASGPFAFSYPDGTVPATGSTIRPCENFN
jgi:hypothetical protein